MSARKPPAKATAPASPPASDAPSPAPEADTKPAPQATAAAASFGVGDVAWLTTGEGDAETKELVIVTSDEGEADVANEDGNHDHLYTVSRVPAGHAVRGDQLTAV